MQKWPKWYRDMKWANAVRKIVPMTCSKQGSYKPSICKKHNICEAQKKWSATKHCMPVLKKEWIPMKVGLCVLMAHWYVINIKCWTVWLYESTWLANTAEKSETKLNFFPWRIFWMDYKRALQSYINYY